MQAKISEIFSSIQGEGLYTGTKQIFIRFFGCNLHCDFCDTKIQEFKLYSIEEVINFINELYLDHHSISLTGGEPLVQVEFLQQLLPLLKEKDQLVYLETNGSLFNEFSEVKDLVDIIAMDIKLPSSTGSKALWQQHQEFLKLAFDTESELFIKSVITLNTNQDDLEKAVKLIADIDKDIPLILQPNFFDEGLENKMKDFLKIASSSLSDVRIMRQEHKFLGVK